MARSQIQYGSQGSDVKELQKILNQNGYKLTEDGIFGANTQNAVKDYQQKNGLSVDGIVGTNTWGSLMGGSTGGSNNTTATNPSFKYDDFKYKDFSYGNYKESDTVKQAQAALNAQLAQKPGEYQSQWQSQLDNTINKILNREKFTYDLNGDALYQQYKDKYTQQAKMAMGDAIGQASAMTGGYGNSYAQSVGQQMYQKEMQNLNDIVPELYQMALDKYNMEGQDLYNQYSMLGDRENMDYGRYRDSVADWMNERDYLAGRYDSEREFDYSKYDNERDFAYSQYADDRNFAYGKYSDDKNLAYSEHRNAIEDALKMDELEYAKERDRIADEQWLKEFNAQYGNTAVDDKTKHYSGTDPKTGGSYNNGGLTTSQIKALQAALGVTADGYYGENSKKAAGGLSAEEAYKKFVGGGGKDEEPETKPSYSSIVSDLNTYIKNGASRSNISTYLRNAWKSGYITESQYNNLKKTYVPQSSSGGIGGHYTY